MPFEPLGNPLIIIPGSIIAVLDILTFPAFILLARSEHKDKIIYLLLFKLISIPASLYFSFTQFGEPYFMGAWYSLAVAILPVYMLVVLGIMAAKLRKEHGSLRKRHKRQLLIGLIIALTIALPAILHMPVKNACTRADAASIPALTSALADYHTAHDAYPATLAELDSLPEPSCQFLSGKPRQFEVRTCPDANPVFYVETVDWVSFDFYEAGTPNHWRIPTLMRRADPGACD